MSIPYHAGPACTCEHIRNVDRLAVESLHVPGIILMENAARSAAEMIFAGLSNPATDRVLVLCGPGNNGGDGYALARHLLNGGVRVTVACAAKPGDSAPDAKANYEIYARLRAPLIDAANLEPSPELMREFGAATVIVDCLLGTGARGSPRGVFATLIRLANAQPARRIAIDIPSGLNGDTGQPHDPCFRADATITFVAEKQGFRSPAARPMLGSVEVVGIGVPPWLVDEARKAGE
ncbi:MAG: NAD(P)H-hydrate epimerase [Planctomycetes bacterium]|nr:NAD(P)H-hydrate epimerase [Planctomycetota bacterium]